MTAQSIAKAKADRYFAEADAAFEKKLEDKRRRYADNPSAYMEARRLLGWKGDAPLGADPADSCAECGRYTKGYPCGCPEARKAREKTLRRRVNPALLEQSADEADPSTLPGYRQHELHEAIVAAYNELRDRRHNGGSNRDERDTFRDTHRQLFADMGFYPPRKIPNWSRATAFILDARLR